MVRNPAAKHPQHGPHQRRQHGQLPGLHFADPKLVIEVTGQKGDQADEAAKSDGINQAERPAVFLKQAGRVLFHAGMLVHIRRLLRKDDHHQHGNQNANGGKAVHRLPAERLGQWRSQQSRHGSADVARADQAHGQAFVLGRKRP